MYKLERLKQNYTNRLINLKYNYATELLDNISDSTYANLLESEKELFAPISGIDAEDYLKQPEVLDSIIKVLENAIAQNNKEDLLRQEILNNLSTLDESDLKRVEDYIESI